VVAAVSDGVSTSVSVSVSVSGQQASGVIMTSFGG
jgi:hypothetical protein